MAKLDFPVPTTVGEIHTKTIRVGGGQEFHGKVQVMVVILLSRLHQLTGTQRIQQFRVLAVIGR